MTEATNGWQPPEWARVVAYLVREVGLATLLVASLLGWIPSPIVNGLHEVKAEVIGHDKDMDAFRAELEKERRFLRLICKHTARSEPQALTCDPMEPTGR